MNQVIQLIESRYGSLSKGQRRIADIIIHRYDDAAFMTAARLGEAAGVSESTVVRFAYALNYNGYPALQEALRDLIRHRLTSAQRIRMAEGIELDDVPRQVLTADMNNIKTTIDMIQPEIFQQCVNHLLEAERVYVLGVGSAAPLAQFFANYLSYICNDVHYVGGSEQDVYERLLRSSVGDVCFGITFPRYSARAFLGMQYAKEHGAKLIALTDQPSSPVAEIADYVLLAHSDMASFVDSLTAPLSLINALLVSVGMKRKDETYQHLMQLEKIWSREGVYVKDSLQQDGGREL